ncbi:hypothetical protein GUITHDRAFT_119337 [Guillardia theta CCMP2712]|uniref:Uncharacterized protein n=1 Tax=Guillardia theta (strain CCMP2712) TaxID=905079 RepID=L1IF69_GUITC|nr:hypothetical protein GUITHDRAFT_119337 [Guillardia theta CCMP2712]EKX34500.1 hypothetical protein GUITHDRAFT_119337 [Guillardia theta CCMP2712]|eukprot:XP_005821480.1 hypothetical protein GUITHDRAFT_119337 [Guillardia theta CCMP2712]
MSSSSSSHDLLPPSSSLSHCVASAATQLYVALVATIFVSLARHIPAAILWLLEDDSELAHALSLREQPETQAPAVVSTGGATGGFDRRKMLEPHFGQTFKVKRVGVL